MRKAGWLLIACVALLPAAWAEDQPATDWPAMIGQLREQWTRLPNDESRHQLAIAYNNYGITLADAGNYVDAVRQLQDALRLEPDDAQFHTNLARIQLRAAQTAYQEYRIPEAKTLIAEAIKLAPDQAESYALLGEIEYHSQRLKEAKTAWEKALKLNPQLPTIQDRMDRLNQELPVESEFEKVSQAYFDIRYNDEMLQRSAGYDLRDALLKARREVGSDFSLWPTRKIIVLVYSSEQFRRLRQDTPEWVAGQYDGKIRVPLPGRDFDEASVIRTLYHEYTHALVHDLTGITCPTWLNEGLAEYEGWRNGTPPWLELRQAAKIDALIPWDRLSAYFAAGPSTQEVALAYEQSHSIVKYFVNRYGFWRMRRILKAVADGADLNETLVAEFHMKLPRLQNAWRSWLNEQLEKG